MLDLHFVQSVYHTSLCLLSSTWIASLNVPLESHWAAGLFFWLVQLPGSTGATGWLFKVSVYQKLTLPFLPESEMLNTFKWWDFSHRSNSTCWTTSLLFIIEKAAEEIGSLQSNTLAFKLGVSRDRVEESQCRGYQDLYEAIRGLNTNKLAMFALAEHKQWNFWLFTQYLGPWHHKLGMNLTKYREHIKKPPVLWEHLICDTDKDFSNMPK